MLQSWFAVLTGVLQALCTQITQKRPHRWVDAVAYDPNHSLARLRKDSPDGQQLDFLTKYGEKGYESGFLKYPTTDEIVLPDNPLNRRQEFQGGSIYFAAGIGAHSINGLIRDRWIALGAQTGYLGYPVSDEIVTPDGAGRYSKFQNGSIYWSPSGGAHAVSGGVTTAWANAGYEGGQYGYPTGDLLLVKGIHLWRGSWAQRNIRQP